MRALRTSLAAAWILGILPVGAQAQVTVEQLLQFRPAVQGVDFESPTDKAAVAACKAESIEKPGGYVLRDGQGKLLRKFVDTDGNQKLDQWSYYLDGFEVYREVDLDGDRSLDEIRWMNSGGTRIATMAGTKISGWKRISAEEASKVLVQAFVLGDAALLETVMATPAELESLGVPESQTRATREKSASRATDLAEIRKTLAGWDAQTVWLRLDGTMPRSIPVDAAAGLKGDLLLYENAVIFAGRADGQGNPSKVAFLQSPEIIKIGDTWKFVDLPKVIDPSKQDAVSVVDGGIRSSIYRMQGTGAGGDHDPRLDAAIKAVADYDTANGEKAGAVDKREVARFHVERVRLLREVVKTAEALGKTDEALIHNKEIVNGLAAAYQTGAYPDGRKLLDALEAQGGPVASHAAFRRDGAEFGLENEKPDANPVAVQKKWIADLKAFLDKYKNSEEAPEALLQLANAHEYNAEEKEAKEYYAKLAEQYPKSSAGMKGAGALRRLDLVGKELMLKGTSLDGRAVDASQYKGKTLLVAFWATWAGPVKRDLPELTKLHEKFRARGFEILGVSLDAERAEVDAFLKTNPLPWIQIHEPGALESRLANEFGIYSLPTMFLVDAEGKVVSRNIRSAADLEVQLEKILPAKSGGVALGGNR